MEINRKIKNSKILFNLLKKIFIFRKILGPSPLFWSLKQIKTQLLFRGGQNVYESDIYSSDDETFFKIMNHEFDTNSNANKFCRFTESEFKKLLSTRSKLTKEQKLLKSVIEDINSSRAIESKYIDNASQMYELRRRYKIYLRLKRIIPLAIIGPFTNNELSKMAYAAALGSKSVALTIPGFIGYALPAFDFSICYHFMRLTNSNLFVNFASIH